MANVKFNRGKTRANSITAAKTTDGYSTVYFPTDSATIVLGIGSTTDNREYGQAVQDAAGTERAFLLGHAVQGSIATTISNANVYMQEDKLYSNNSEVVNVADAQTISGDKTFAGKIIKSGGTGDQVLAADGSVRAIESVVTTGSDSLVTSGAVDVQIKTIDDRIAALEATGPSVNITWSELKALRDAGSLIPGTQYRITDYICTTVTRGTKSAGHQFDIIVRADSENKINEEASAIQHEGDTYFTNSNLSAWKLWYCLDNDTTRFAWADTTNGRGVIYRMIDEWNNDIPYDFKNIIYVSVQSFYYNTNWGSIEFIRDSSKDMNIGGTQYYGYSSSSGQWGPTECWIKEEVPSPNSTLYDKNGEYLIGLGGGFISNISSEASETYTFGESDDSTITSSSCYNNIILPCKSYGSSIFMLNDNTFGSGSHDNKFSSGCHGNKFGNYCSNNKFDPDCYYNTFGNGCSNNKFGNYCSDNKFGNYCSDNKFDPGCDHNTFDSDCDRNSFGNRCEYNTFGGNCASNTFGYGCSYNILRSDCGHNSIGDVCKYIEFTHTYYYNNHFGGGCRNIKFTGDDTGAYNNRVQNYNFASGLEGAGSAYLTVDGIRNLSYEVKVEKDSRGTLKMYCLADMIMSEISENDNPYSYPDSTQYIGEI